MTNNYTVNPFVNTNEAEKFQFILDGYMSRKYFIELATVIAVNDDNTVDVMPLNIEIARYTNAPVDRAWIYNVPIWQLQRDSSAIIMTPVIGDIGVILICDNDITAIKETKAAAAAQSLLTHSRSDAIYLGGVLNTTPTQFIRFNDNSIEINSPGAVNITAPSLAVKADSVTINASTVAIVAETSIDGNLTVTGNIIGNTVADSVGTLGSLRSTYEVHTHPVGGVESGNSSVISGKPSA